MTINDAKEALERRTLDSRKALDAEMNAIIKEDRNKKTAPSINRLKARRELEMRNDNKSIVNNFDYLEL